MLNMCDHAQFQTRKSEKKNLRNQKELVIMNAGKKTFADILKNPSAALNPGMDP